MITNFSICDVGKAINKRSVGGVVQYGTVPAEKDIQNITHTPGTQLINDKLERYHQATQSQKASFS